ncbi:hypothetical protein [Kitasatospora kifunensis]|uniref:Uncharacterized protein n=1 Tax=Kitasatospora kifunensis TaxID=58351 RepID=A0A7W7VY15_KITKI|nr:hypothetical protein [Kitasatospora kifunensis]MBB4927076.1 hypothetical protein [Kitasatospora kifunensis]
MAKTMEQYRAEQRAKKPSSNPLDDYDPTAVDRYAKHLGAGSVYVQVCECPKHRRLTDGAA